MPNPDIEGPDATEEGTWRCEDRGFRERMAASFGGVLFAQSTQAMQEEQRFPEGSALVIPPRSVIVGGVHLLNVSSAPIESAIRFRLSSRSAEEVDTRLQLVNLDNAALEIPTGGESRFGMSCDMESVYRANLDTEADYSVYYVLPHYHEWGNYFRLAFVDEDGSERTVYETTRGIGEPLGSIVDPPMHSNGARYLRMECGYFNNDGEVVTWGFGGHEMCVSLVYIDGGLKIAGGSQGDSVLVGEQDGRPHYESQCGPLSAVNDSGAGSEGNPVCGAGNSYLGGDSSAHQRIDCDVAGAILVTLNVEVSAIPRTAVVPGEPVELQLSARVEIDEASAERLDAIARGKPSEVAASSSILEFVGGTVGADPVEVGLAEVPCEVDYSMGAVPVVPPEQTVRVQVAEDATSIDIRLGEFTLVTRTPAATYMTTGELPDDPMGQILTKCTATEAVIQVPID